MTSAVLFGRTAQPFDLAYAELAAEIQADNPGWTVIYDGLGLVATCGEERIGPCGLTKIKALLGSSRRTPPAA